MLKKITMLVAALGSLSGCVANYDDPYYHAKYDGYDGRYDGYYHNRYDDRYYDGRNYGRYDRYDRYERHWNYNNNRNYNYENCSPSNRSKGQC